jgi:hypothetical protein
VRPAVILFIDKNTNFLFRADHEQLRYEDSVLAGSRSTDPSPARIGKMYGHKKLLQLGAEVTELLVET